MLVYNITTKVHASVDAAWLQWQHEENIPATMATGFFTAYKLLRLLEQDDAEGNTYAIQYTATTAEQYDQFINIYAPQMRKKATEKWAGAIISFHSVLEVIQ
ncbi:MAG: DUF4286 family protein [Chitinophagaceae bacterium]